MKEVKRDRVVTVRLSEQEWLMVNEMSFELGLSQSEVIRKTIENYYKYYRFCP